jgi:hypothetical protein
MARCRVAWDDVELASVCVQASVCCRESTGAMLEAILMLTGNRPILIGTTLGSIRSSSAIQSLTVTIAIPLTSVSTTAIHHLDVSALNHESIDDAVECRVIVKGIIDEIEEVLDMLWSLIRVEFDDYFTLDS